MHDMDRTRAEYEGLDALEADFEFEGGGGLDEFEGLYAEGEGVFGEAQEMELAAQLLEVTDEAEFDQFLGSLIKSAGKAVGSFVRSPTGQALGSVIKTAARKALPIAGSAVGNFLLPGVGGAMGAQLASGAGRLFGLELEGLSSEDQEFEIARRWVRLVGDATKHAVQQVQQGASPQQVAVSAVAKAARKHAPGLLQSGVLSQLGQALGVGGRGNGSNGQGELGRRGGGGYGYGGRSDMSGDGGSGGGGSQSGRWYRRGGRIVIVGA